MLQCSISAAGSDGSHHITVGKLKPLMEGSSMYAGEKTSRRRSFFDAIGRAYGASIEYERLSAMSDRALAARNLTRAQIPQYIMSRL